MGVAVKRTMYQRKVDVDMLNTVKSVLADVSSVSPSSEQSSVKDSVICLASLVGVKVCVTANSPNTVHTFCSEQAGRSEIRIFGPWGLNQEVGQTWLVLSQIYLSVELQNVV